MIIGNCGQEPEMRFTPSGKAVTSFSIAAGYSYTTSEGERKEETEWFNVVAWGKLAEICNQYLTKGKQVYVEGRQQTRKWDSDDGVAHYKTELIANTVLFLGKKEQTVTQGVESQETGFDADDLPFS